MNDLSIDQNKPWSGPGPDPRKDKFNADEADEEENIDADDGDETYLDPGL